MPRGSYYHLLSPLVYYYRCIMSPYSPVICGGVAVALGPLRGWSHKRGRPFRCVPLLLSPSPLTWRCTWVSAAKGDTLVRRWCENPLPARYGSSSRPLTDTDVTQSHAKYIELSVEKWLIHIYDAHCVPTCVESMQLLEIHTNSRVVYSKSYYSFALYSLIFPTGCLLGSMTLGGHETRSAKRWTETLKSGGGGGGIQPAATCYSKVHRAQFSKWMNLKPWRYTAGYDAFSKTHPLVCHCCFHTDLIVDSH